jgi:hypothetical protein
MRQQALRYPGLPRTIVRRIGLDATSRSTRRWLIVSIKIDATRDPDSLILRERQGGEGDHATIHPQHGAL